MRMLLSCLVFASVLGEGLPAHAGTRRVGRELCRVRPAPPLNSVVRRKLDTAGLPHFLGDDQAPIAEQLWTFKAPVGVGRMTSDIDPRLASGIVLKMLGQIREPSHYLFVGNGLYSSYLVAKALFRGTAMEQRILSLPVSRTPGQESFQAEMRICYEIDPFYRYLALESRKGNLAVIDAVSFSEKTPNDHSLDRVVQGIRRYLGRAGVAEATLRNQVVALAIPELGMIRAHQATTLEGYRAKLQAFGHQELVARIPERQLPFLRSTVDSWEGFIEASYSSLSAAQGPLYWAGKYTEIDARGFPVPRVEAVRINPTRALRDETHPIRVTKTIEGRLAKVVHYQRLLAAVEEYRESDASTQALIERILADNAADSP